jgi:hypothetical protein
MLSTVRTTTGCLSERIAFCASTDLNGHPILKLFRRACLSFLHRWKKRRL